MLEISFVKSWSKKRSYWFDITIVLEKQNFLSLYDIEVEASANIHKDINPTHDSPVSNHNKNQFSDLDIGSRFSRWKSFTRKRGRPRAIKCYSFLIRWNILGIKCGKRWKREIVFLWKNKKYNFSNGISDAWLIFLFTHQLGHHFPKLDISFFLLVKNEKQQFLRVSRVAKKCHESLRIRSTGWSIKNEKVINKK